MKTVATKRKIWLGLALILTLAATAYLWVNDAKTVGEADLVVAAAEPQANRTTSATNDAARTPDKLPDRELQEASRDIFVVPRKEPEPEQKKSAVTLAPPPPVNLSAPPVAQVAPPPTAPPLPFTYIGRLDEDGKYTVFLGARGRNYAVKVGEVIAQVYRVDEIKPPMMTMTYLPLSIKQTMQIGEAN